MRVPLLTPQDEITLAARIKKGDSEARAWMIKANLRLVVKIAHDYLNLGLPFLDLISEGNLALTKAVERFDSAKGGKLSTYGAWRIKQSIKRALANQSKTIRLPVHLIDKIYKLNRASLRNQRSFGVKRYSRIRSSSLSVISSFVRSYELVVRGDSCPAICWACSSGTLDLLAAITEKLSYSGFYCTLDLEQKTGLSKFQATSSRTSAESINGRKSAPSGGPTLSDR